jgi:competence protein ComEC
MKLPVASFFIAASIACGAAQAARTLDIYFIDVEGGQSTLLVTPSGQSLLIDTGFSGNGARDANRIAAAARDAGIKRIDYLLITHFHSDHEGGAAELSQLMPIDTFIDHGSTAESERDVPAAKAAFDAYAAVRSKGKHLEPKPGDTLPLQDIEATVVSAAGATISQPFAGASGKNQACSSFHPADDQGENPRSTGIVVQFGKFRFLDLGDLTAQPMFNLVCPADLIGPVDVYLVAHHGGADAAEAATFAAFNPRVAVMNNGLKKGGALATYELLHHVQGLKDVWQLHSSEAAGNQNFAAAQIANLDESTAHWIKLSASDDGSFKVTNGRTKQMKSYARK